MNRKWWKFLFLLPISVCTLYAGGYAAQFIKNYQEWTSAGNFAGNGTYPQAASLHPLVCFHTRSEERRVGKECRSRWSPYH